MRSRFHGLARSARVSVRKFWRRRPTVLSVQTFGITFGTSGCDPDGRVTGGTGKMVLAFMENNMEQFAMDAAAGRGETIETLAGIVNMDSEKLGELTKENFLPYYFRTRMSTLCS
ncbi:MAG: DUF3015 family protein [Alphaproteobacteria bacterium]